MYIFKKPIILFLLFSISSPVYCGINVWTQGTGFGNYDVYAIAVDTTTTGLVYASGGGMWRSFDGGLSWLTSGWDPYSEGCESIAIDPVFPNIVWAGTPSGPFRSVDYASTWQVVPTNLDSSGIAEIYGLYINPQDRSKMYAGTTNTPFFVSNDTGMTWQPSYTGMTSTEGDTDVLVRHPQDYNTFYAGVGGGPGVYVSTDGCSTWQSKPTPFGVVQSLAMDPINTNVLYAGLYGIPFNEVNGAIWKTTDGGDTWSQLTGYPLVKPVMGLLVNPETTNYVYAATWGAGVWKSKDAGITWSPITAGLPQLHVWCLVYDSTIHQLYCGAGTNDLIHDPPRGVWQYIDNDFVAIEDWFKY